MEIESLKLKRESTSYKLDEPIGWPVERASVEDGAGGGGSGVGAVDASGIPRLGLVMQARALSAALDESPRSSQDRARTH
jgi:hypothetical protein